MRLRRIRYFALAAVIALAAVGCGGRSSLFGPGDGVPGGGAPDAGPGERDLPLPDLAPTFDGGPDGARDLAMAVDQPADRVLPPLDQGIPPDAPERCENLPPALRGYTPPVRIDLRANIVDLSLVSDGELLLVATAHEADGNRWASLQTLSLSGSTATEIGFFPGATAVRLGAGRDGTVGLLTYENGAVVIREVNAGGRVLLTGSYPVAAAGPLRLARPTVQPLGARDDSGAVAYDPRGWWVGFNDGTTLTAGTFVPSPDQGDLLGFELKETWSVDQPEVAVAVSPFGTAYVLVPRGSGGPDLNAFAYGGGADDVRRYRLFQLPSVFPAMLYIAHHLRAGDLMGGADTLSFFGLFREQPETEYLAERFQLFPDDGFFDNPPYGFRDLHDEVVLQQDLAGRGEGTLQERAGVALVQSQEDSSVAMIYYNSARSGGAGFYQSVPDLEGAALASIAHGPCGPTIAAVVVTDSAALHTVIFPPLR